MSGTPSWAGMTRSSRSMVVSSGVTLACVAIQFVLAGYGTFERQYHHADDGWFEPHQILGYAIGLLTLAVLATAVITRQARGFIVRAGILVVLAVPLQPVLAQLGTETNPWFGALHALSGVAIAGLTGALFGQTLRSAPGQPNTQTPAG
jgi:hypothetical protein